MQRIVIMAVFVISFISQIVSAAALNENFRHMVWQVTDRGIPDTDILIVSADPDNAEIVYASSMNTVFRTTDRGNNWEEIVSFRGTGIMIHALAAGPEITQSLYICTGDGLYRKDIRRMKLEKIYSGIGEEEGTVRSIAINSKNENYLYIGTGAGIFFTKNRGNDWEKGRNMPSDTDVNSIAIDKNDQKIIYTATDRGIFKSLNGGETWDRMYESSFSMENGYDLHEQKTLDSDERGTEKSINNIVMDHEKSDLIYAGSSNGLLLSEDSGSTWKMASSLGLASLNIQNIAVDPSDGNYLYVATGKGVFVYSKATENWDELYKGLVSTDVRYLDIVFSDKESPATLWAATGKGVFKLVHVNGPEGLATEMEQIMSNFSHEPSIAEVREAAIVYAEVHPDKIRKWRKAAAHRAWLPSMRFGYDSNEDWQSSTYFYSTSKEKYENDDITDGRDSGWSVSLSWELGDLIWNNDQTAIDSRSRYAVQLRDDILNAVTRLFFERRRLQIDMRISPSEDVIKRVEMELRIQELTANIDALTGSMFSNRVALKKNEDAVTLNKIVFYR